jgi:hypothetical protein
MRACIAFMIAVAPLVFVASEASAVTPLECYTQCMRGPTSPGVDRFCRIFCKRQFGGGSTAAKSKGTTGSGAPAASRPGGKGATY